MTAHQVTYQINTAISPEQFVELLGKCSLGERRPLDNYYLIKGMLDNANLLITAWADKSLDNNEKELVGVARCVSDFSYCCYLSDLAVAEDYQNQGIGKLMIKKSSSNYHPAAKLFFYLRQMLVVLVMKQSTLRLVLRNMIMRG